MMKNLEINCYVYTFPIQRIIEIRIQRKCALEWTILIVQQLLRCSIDEKVKCPGRQKAWNICSGLLGLALCILLPEAIA